MKLWRNPSVVVPAWAAVGASLVAARPSWWALAGLGAWPLVEYFAHRFAMHGLAARFPRAYRKAHGAHHRHPRDRSHFLVPPAWVALVALALAALLPLAAVGGLLAAMALYDLVHQGCHGVGLLRGRLPRVLVAHHAGHHADEHANYSVTFPPLDRLFGTLR